MELRKFQWILIGVLLTLNCQGAVAWDDEDEGCFYWIKNFYEDVKSDYSIAYGPDNLIRMGGLLLGAGVLANTGLDRSFNHFYQEQVRSDETNQFFKPQKDIGVYNYSKIYVGSIVVGHLISQYHPVGDVVYEWGYRTLRALLIVSPQITVLRRVLGAGGPRGRGDDASCSDGSSSHSKKKNKHFNENSKWKLFRNGRSSCSGHTFNGALPFLTAAMMTDSPYKYGFYALSVLPGLARINDGKHYLSQVILGWGLSYLAARAVDETERSFCDCIQVGARSVDDGVMITAGLRF